MPGSRAALVETVDDIELIDRPVERAVGLSPVSRTRRARIPPSAGTSAVLVLAPKRGKYAAELSAKGPDDMVEDGKITVTCEFCSSTYVFEPAEIALGIRLLLRPRSNSIESDHGPIFCFEHNFVQKPVSTFRDHALARRGLAAAHARSNRRFNFRPCLVAPDKPPRAAPSRKRCGRHIHVTAGIRRR